MAQDTALTSYRFRPIPNKQWQFLKDHTTTDLLMKWSMQGRISVQAFCFDRHLNVYEKDEFVREFLTEPAVVSTLRVLSDQGRWACLAVPAETVTVEHVPCTETTLQMFDKLTEGGVVREGGRIRKCMEEYVDDLVLADELRKLCAAPEESSYGDLFDPHERAQFLFRLLAHLAVGGRWCQYEDTVQPYLDVTKQVYKELIGVCRTAEAGALRVTSHVFQVTATAAGGVELIPRQQENMQNFFYVIVDPLKRHVTTFYHQFGGMLPEPQ